MGSGLLWHSSNDSFLLAVPLRCPAACPVPCAAFHTKLCSREVQLSSFPSAQVHFPPASQCSHAGHSSAALGPVQPLQHWERPDVSYGTMPRSISSRRIRYQQGVRSFLKISWGVASEAKGAWDSQQTAWVQGVVAGLVTPCASVGLQLCSSPSPNHRAAKTVLTKEPGCLSSLMLKTSL